MSVDINQEALRRSEAQHRLADALSDDILNTPAEDLIAEVAEDHADGRALAKTFNRILMRAIRQSTWQRIGSPPIELWAKISSVVAWRPVMASIAAVLMVVIAVDLSVHRQRRTELQTIVRAPTVRGISERPAIANDQSERLKNQEFSEAASASRSGNPARIPSPDGVLVGDHSTSGPPVTPRPIVPDHNMPAANASPPLPQVGQAIPPSPQPTVDQPAGSAERVVSAAVSNAVPASAAVPPFIWPVRGRVVVGFGRRAGRLRNNGINIAVPEGTDIRAADAGVVMYAGSDVKGYGNLVLLRHSNGFVTTYAHASALLVNLGETVQRGQIIAKSGSSGDVTEPLVHFEIRKGTLPIDPVRYLPPD